MLHGGSLLKPPCQRVGVTPLLKGIRNGGLDFVKAAVRLSVGHGDCLLNDGFFSFAVVRQVTKLLCFFTFHFICILIFTFPPNFFVNTFFDFFAI